MTSKFVVSTALLAAVLFSGNAAAQQDPPASGARGHHYGRAVAKADTDKDGSLSHAEFVAAHEKHFARLDMNRDGKVDRNEFMRARDKTERKGQRRESIFSNADANHNGVISKEEWMMLAEKRFTKHDRNADGKPGKEDRASARQRAANPLPPVTQTPPPAQ